MITKRSVGRLLSTLLCLVLLLGQLPTTALAVAASPYSVSLNNKQLNSGYYLAANNSTNATLGNPDSGYVAKYKDGILTLNGYNGGRIGLVAATANHFTIKLIGNNTVNSGQICIRQQSTGGASGVTITSDSGGTLTLNATSDNAVWAINANESSATGQGQNEVVINGSAKVTINATMTGANQQCTGIYAKNVTIQGSASLKITCKAESNTNAGFVTGVYTWGTTTVNTTGNIDIDVSAAGGENCTSYGLGGSSSNTLTLTKVGNFTAKWKNSTNDTTYKGAAFYPINAEFANVKTNYAKNTTSTTVSYRSGTPYTVTVKNGKLTGPGVSEAIYKGQFLAGDTVNIAPNEKKTSGGETIPFAEWTSAGVTISSPATASNSFTVPEKNVTVTATYNPFFETPTFTPTGSTNTTGTLEFKTVVKPNGSSEYFNLVAEADKDNTTKYKSINLDSSSKSSPYTYSGSMDSSSFSAGKYYVAATLGGDWYLSEPFTVSYVAAPTPAAAVDAVTVSGEQGREITPTEVSIRLTDCIFADSIDGSEGWITNLPTGLSQSVTRIRDTQAKITVSGTPTKKNSAAIKVTVPKTAIKEGVSDVVAAVNENARFAIVGAYKLTLKNCTATVDGEAVTNGSYVEEGAAVTVTADVPENYKFGDWIISGVEYTVNDDNTATFTMPGKELTVTANLYKATIRWTKVPLNKVQSATTFGEIVTTGSSPGPTDNTTITIDWYGEDGTRVSASDAIDRTKNYRGHITVTCADDYVFEKNSTYSKFLVTLYGGSSGNLDEDDITVSDDKKKLEFDVYLINLPQVTIPLYRGEALPETTDCTVSDGCTVSELTWQGTGNAAETETLTSLKVAKTDNRTMWGKSPMTLSVNGTEQTNVTTGDSYLTLTNVTLSAPERPTGVTVSGTAMSWNDTNDALYYLYPSTMEDTAIKAEWKSGSYTGTVCTSKGTPTASGKQFEQTFQFDTVAAGSYKLVIFKPGKYVPKIVPINVSTTDYDCGQLKLWLYGDVNYDGAVKTIDITMARQYFKGNLTLTDEQIAVMDMNGDGAIKVIDITILRQYFKGNISEIPIT